MKGETLPSDTRIYHVKVVTAFLQSGVPLSKISGFRSILEENGLRLTDRCHMSDIIPLILVQEQARIKQEISGKPVSLVFEETSRLGEAMAILVRFINPTDWSIQQQLI